MEKLLEIINYCATDRSIFSSSPADLYNVLTDWFTEVHWCVATTSTINIALNTGEI